MTHPKKKKKAKKIDRDRKTIKILGKRIPTDTLCVGLLVLILVVSSFAVFISRGSNGEEKTENRQARVVFSNENELIVSETIHLTEDMIALEAFREIGAIGLGHTNTGVYVKSVSYNQTKIERNETHGWYFYVNGGLKLKAINEYRVQHGETIQLRFEEKSY